MTHLLIVKPDDESLEPVLVVIDPTGVDLVIEQTGSAAERIFPEDPVVKIAKMLAEEG